MKICVAGQGAFGQKHLDALKRLGPTPLHRYSFAPVREAGCWSTGATQAPLPIF